MATWRRSLVTIVLVAQAMGCIVLVPPIEHAGHCDIGGSTACAACLRTSCQTAIDSCCNDASCSGSDGHSSVLDALDACGTGDAAACADRLDSAETGAAAGARSCVTTTCKAACLANVVVPNKWSCGAVRTPDNACATCLYDKCGSALDECCSDSSCSASTSVADDVGRCSGGDAPGCVFLTTKSMSGYEGKVRGCIAKSCATECMGDARMHESCELQGGGSYCQCSDAEKSKGPDCSVSSMGGNCVLGEKGCTCGHYACEESSGSLGGCSCSFRGDAGGSTKCDVIRTESEGVCCVKRQDTEFTCECSTYRSDCSTTLGEYLVPTCNIEDVVPKLENVLVPKCSN